MGVVAVALLATDGRNAENLDRQQMGPMNIILADLVHSHERLAIGITIITT